MKNGERDHTEGETESQKRMEDIPKEQEKLNNTKVVSKALRVSIILY